MITLIFVQLRFQHNISITALDIYTIFCNKGIFDCTISVNDNTFNILMAFIIINDFFNFLYKVLAKYFYNGTRCIYNILQKKKKKVKIKLKKTFSVPITNSGCAV